MVPLHKKMMYASTLRLHGLGQSTVVQGRGKRQPYISLIPLAYLYACMARAYARLCQSGRTAMVRYARGNRI